MTEWFQFISKASRSSIAVIQVHAPTTDAKEVEVGQFYVDLENFLQQTRKKKKMFFSSLVIRMQK